MILKFPDLNTLRLALINGAIPPNMSSAGAVAGFDDQEQCWVETSAQLAKNSSGELKRLGVVGSRAFTAPVKEEVSCWAEILPLEHDRNGVLHLEQTPVLFDLADGEELSR